MNALYFRQKIPFQEKKSTTRQLIDDELSDLDASPFYNILTRLSFKDKVRIGSLSKNLRAKCLMSKDLKFNKAEHKSREDELTFLDFYMTLRKDLEVRKLCVRWYQSNPDERFSTALSCALKRNVQELEIDYKPEEGKPLDLSQCTSLRSCDAMLYGGMVRLLQLESSKGFDFLEVLSLRCVRIVGEGSLERLVSSCKLLRELRLEELSLGACNNLRIVSASLEEISIVKPSDELDCLDISGERLRVMILTWFFSSRDKKSLNLSAPNLKRLYWRGDAVEKCCMSRCSSLKSASINLRRNSSSILSYDPNMVTGEDLIFDRLYELMHIINTAQILKLNLWHIEVLFSRTYYDPKPLENVQDLVVNVSEITRRDQVHALISFLKLTPNLKSLSLKNSRQSWGPNYMTLEDPNKMSLDYENMCWEDEWLVRLQNLEIELTGAGGDEEIELVKFLVEHSKNLKKMMVLYSPLDSWRSPEIAKSMSGFKKASSQILILFLPYI